MEQLQNWNPSLNTSSDECAFTEGYRYCMEAYKPVETTSMPSPTTAQSSTPTSTQLPIRDGTTKDCKKYVPVVSPMTCKSVLQDNDITIAQFYQWSPAVGPKCQNLWLDYRYCVDGPGTSTTTSSSNGGPPGPTQSGIPDNCNKWHVVKEGESCQTLAKEYDITLKQFYKWNPAVKKDCTEGFWKDEAYCVGVGE